MLIDMNELKDKSIETVPFIESDKIVISVFLNKYWIKKGYAFNKRESF